MTRVIFERCRFNEVTFMYGRLRGATFRDCVLRDSYLRSADLRDVMFVDTQLVSVSLENADLQGARFENVQLEAMDNWGWHGYEGAEIADDQKYKYFLTEDPGPRLRRAGASELNVPRDRVIRFVEALEAKQFSSGELMLIHAEWRDAIDFADFIEVGKFLTSTRGV